MTKFKVTLGTSSTLETQAGELPPSIVVFGPMYQFKEFVKDQFSSIRYTDLVFDGAVKVRARPALLARRPAPCPLPRAARTSRAHATSSPQAAWVLPLSGETDETGTLARFLGTLVCSERLGIRFTKVS